MTRIRTNLLFLLLAAAPFGFAQRGPAIEQQLTFGPYHPSGIYNVGELVGWTITPGPATPTYSYKWTIRRNNAVVLKEGKLDLSSGKDTIEITGDQPEMLYVAVEPYATLGTPAPAPQAAPEAGRGAVPLTPAAIPAATTDSTPSAPPSHPRNSDLPRRAPMTSMRSGTASWPPRRKSRSTPCSRRFRLMSLEST